MNVPVEETLALAGVTLNVTGTVTDEPETSVSPVAKGVKATVVASTAVGIAGAVRLLVGGAEMNETYGTSRIR